MVLAGLERGVHVRRPVVEGVHDLADHVVPLRVFTGLRLGDELVSLGVGLFG